jgi:hypothetical protein
VSAVLAFKSAANDSNYAVDQSQGSGLFGEYMLMELVLEVVRNSTDPQGRLAELFDRVNTRARGGGLAMEKNSVMTQFRKHAETFFLMAGKNV